MKKVATFFFVLLSLYRRILIIHLTKSKAGHPTLKLSFKLRTFNIKYKSIFFAVDGEIKLILFQLIFINKNEKTTDDQMKDHVILLGMFQFNMKILI